MSKVIVLIALAFLAGVASRAVATEPVEVFTRPGCPRCAAAERFLGELERERPELRIVLHDVERDPSALERLRSLASRQGIEAVGLPAFHVRGTLIVGFTGGGTEAHIRGLLAGARVAPGETEEDACPPDQLEPCSGAEPVDGISVPLLGRVATRDVGLPLFTVVVGLVDGFNPCAMWVLLFLLSLLVNVHDRLRMVLVAGTFVLVSGAVYFAFMAAWLNVFLLIGLSRATRVALGLAAVSIGLVHVKDFFAFGRGLSFSIPARAKPHLYDRMRRILGAEHLFGALAGVIVLAVLANSVELLCTAGLPAVYTEILTLRRLPWWGYYAYLLLYNAAYMLDDAIMVGLAVVTLERYKLQERGGRWLKLLSGGVMLALGLALIADVSPLRVGSG